MATAAKKNQDGWLKKEVREAEAVLKETEKRCEVIYVDVEKSLESENKKQKKQLKVPCLASLITKMSTCNNHRGISRHSGYWIGFRQWDKHRQQYLQNQRWWEWMSRDQWYIKQKGGAAQRTMIYKLSSSVKIKLFSASEYSESEDIT